MDSLYNLTVFDIYKKNARYLNGSTAIHFEKQDISHADLFSQTAGFAGGLKQLNLPPGSRIAVLCSNHPVFFHLFGAASALNLALVLINRRLSPEEISYIIEDTTPAAIFCDQEMAGQAGDLVKSFPFLKYQFTVDADDKAFDELYKAPPVKNAFGCRPPDPYIIIHTAAVQGKPRGAVLGQENVILSNLQMIHAYGLDQTRSFLNILPLFHIMGINLALGTLHAGGKNVILNKFDPSKTIDLIQEQQITILGSFPPILTNLLETIKTGNKSLSSLEITAGIDAPETINAWEQATGSTFWTMYGQTETSGLISFTEYNKNPGSAGVVSPFAFIRIADEYDTFLPQGQTGEILVKGPLVFQGYWNAPQLNAHTFRNGWHHTGDLGMLDKNGLLYFKGRKAEKELIKPGGENVFPVEVEKTILTHEAVRDVCVFGVPDPKFGEGVKAVCSLRPGFSLTKDELIKFCGSKIAGYKKPRYVEFIKNLPKADDGSVDREKIKSVYT